MFRRRKTTPNTLMFQARHAYIAARRAGISRDTLLEELAYAEQDHRMVKLWEEGVKGA